MEFFFQQENILPLHNVMQKKCTSVYARMGSQILLEDQLHSIFKKLLKIFYSIFPEFTPKGIWDMFPQVF